MTVTRSTTWVDGNTLTASALNGEFNNLLNAPAIMNADIAAGAAIATTKINFGSVAQGGVPYDSGAGTIVELPAGTSGQFLQTQGANSNPVWGTVSHQLQSIQATTTTDSSGDGSSDTQVIHVTFTPSSTANCVVMFSLNWFNGGVASNFGDVYLDGVLQSVNNLVQTDFTSANKSQTVAGHFYLTNLNNTSHTVAIYTRRNGGNISVQAAQLTVLVFNAT
jgi:hypothetical protein